MIAILAEKSAISFATIAVFLEFLWFGPIVAKKIRDFSATINRSAPAKVYTDYLVHYLSLVPCEVHVRGKRGTTHIERHNLNLRTHLKRLNRKTICFTRSAAILYAILKIYFWG